jgi:hypothetical protein
MLMGMPVMGAVVVGGQTLTFGLGQMVSRHFVKKSKGMALCSRFVMIRLEGGENE